MAVRVRFAPSPTGYLHIGGLRTALYCYLFARHHSGQVVLRIEDTDQLRYVEDAEEDITTCLKWAGLQVDEGPVSGGMYGPYRQSERSVLYRQYVTQLVQSGHAYYAFDSPEDLRYQREQGIRYDVAGRHQMKNSFTMDDNEVKKLLAQGAQHVIRLAVPEDQTVRFVDLIRGDIAIKTSQIDDQVLLKADGMPTYHLANVVDDHLMGITHVIRGEEWISSTPKHLLLYKAFDWKVPQMAHLPLIMSPGGGKLSKRKAQKEGVPVSVRDYREEGYEPEALLNFLAFLGWNPGTEKEVFILTELVELFTLNRVGSSSAQFSLEKLHWFNQQHLRRMTSEDLLLRLRRYCSASVSDTYLWSVATLVRERITLARDVITEYKYFFDDPKSYDPKGVKKRWKPDSAELLTSYAHALANTDSFSEAIVEQELRTIAARKKVGAGRIIHPTRLAVSGTTAGPGLFGMLAVLGREICVRRLHRAVEVLSGGVS